MQNLVGSRIPSAEEMEALRKSAQGLTEELKKYGILLDPDERQTLTRGREGGEPYVERVLELSAKYGVSIRSVSQADVRADLELVRLLGPLKADLELALQLLKDTLAEAVSEAWEGGFQLYGVLNRMSESDAELDAELKPIREFFKPKKRRPPAAAPDGGAA